MKVTVVELAPKEPARSVPAAKPTAPVAGPVRPVSARLPTPTVPAPVGAPVEPVSVASSDHSPPTVAPERIATYPKARPRVKTGPAQRSGTPTPVRAPSRPSGAPLWTPPTESDPPLSTGSPNRVPSDADSVVSARPDRFVKLNDVAAVTVLQAASVEARFEVAADGTAKVSLLKGTGIADIDAKIVEFLSNVRWTPKTVGGVPVADVVIMDLDTEG